VHFAEEITVIRRIAFVAVFVAGATGAGAQISRGRPGAFSAGPSYWVGLSYGYMDGLTLNDGHSNSTWAFRYTSQLRATLEKSMSGGFSLGASAGFSNPKLSYVGRTVGDPCGPGTAACQADAQVTQYMAFIRSGGGLGFHGLFQLEAGATQFARFRDRSTGNTLGSSDAKYDFTFGFGGGFGYGISPNTDFYISDQLDIVLHPQGDIPESSSAPRVTVFRVGARIGF
jgi:hypothetical protein